MPKDLWIKVKVDDKELAELGKKTQKTIEGSIEKGMKTGAQKGAGGGAAAGGGGTGMFGQMTQAIQRAQIMQTATQGAGQAVADWIGAARGSKLRSEAEANTIKSAAALGGAVIGAFSSTGGQLATQTGQAVAEEIFREPLAIERGAQSRLQAYMNKMTAQGVSLSKEDQVEIASRFANWEKRMYENEVNSRFAVNAATQSMFNFDHLKDKAREAAAEAETRIKNKIISFRDKKEE